MQTKTTKTKSVQDDIDNLKKRREERKAKENRKMALSNANHDTMGKYMDMIRWGNIWIKITKK